MVFVLLSSLRPFAGLCNRVGHNSRKKCLFALLVLYIWLVSLLYAATVGVLAVSAPYYCLRPANCRDRPSPSGPRETTVNRMTVWVLIAMLFVPTALLCGVVIVYCIVR